MDKSGSEASARNIAQKKREAEIEEQRQQLEMGRVARERKQALEAAREKGEKEIVEISAAANNQMDNLKKVNSERVHALDANTQKNYQALAQKTADDLKRLDSDAAAAVEAHKFGTMEKIKNVTDRSQDPFYRMRSLEPALSETDTAYTIQVKLAEHEAGNLYVSGEGPYVKLSLARRFQDDAKAPEGNRSTKTSSFQSVVEQVAMPGAYDAKKIERTYNDGVVTIKIPKQNFGAPPKA